MTTVDVDHARVSYDRFQEFERLMKVYPRSYAAPMNPAPLGFCAFALTLFVYSFIQCGATVPLDNGASNPAVLTQTSVSGAMGLALFYGGLIQLIAGLLEFRIGNNFRALLFCSYAGYWFSLASLYVNGSFQFGLNTAYTDLTVYYKVLGIFYLGWLIFTLALLIAAIRTDVVTVVFLFFLMLTFIMWTSSYYLTFHANLHRAGGAFGIFTAVIAWFLGFASLLRRGDNAYFNLPNYSLAPKTRADLNAEVPVTRGKV